MATYWNVARIKVLWPVVGVIAYIFTTVSGDIVPLDENKVARKVGRKLILVIESVEIAIFDQTLIVYKVCSCKIILS